MEIKEEFKSSSAKRNLFNALIAGTLSAVFLTNCTNNSRYLLMFLWLIICFIHLLRFKKSIKYSYINVYETYMEIDGGLFQEYDKLTYHSIENIEVKKWHYKITSDYGRKFKLSKTSIKRKDFDRFEGFMQFLIKLK